MSSLPSNTETVPGQRRNELSLTVLSQWDQRHAPGVSSQDIQAHWMAPGLLAAPAALPPCAFGSESLTYNKRSLTGTSGWLRKKNQLNCEIIHQSFLI